MYSVNIQDVFKTTCIDTKNPFVLDPLVVHYDVSNGSSSTGNVGLQMDFGQAPPTYSVGFGEIVDNVVRSSPGNPACNAQSYSITDPQDPWGPGLLLGPGAPPTTTPLPANVSPLIGSATFGSYDGTFGAGSNATWTISWSFAPVFDADVVVTIPNYDTWRPTAGRNETEIAGDLLTVQAKLVQKSTGQPAVGVIPDKWSFSLTKFSNEPGVAMNWPPVKDRVDPLQSPPDITFNKQINATTNPNLKISNNDTLAEILNPSQTPSPQNGEVILVPFDWGGWATLNVTATVFGVPIKGHLQLASGQNVTDILLPKRQPSSHIADVWKTQNNIPLSTPDSDDSETDPDGLPGCVGDGLTLYEEYRGFMENAKHIEGDPHKKDFFIQNLIGADAEPGIAMFTRLTQLNVHKDIQKAEMDGLHTDTLPPHPGTRLINFNHGQGAHVVDQHGVYIRECRFKADGSVLLGGDTGFSVTGVHGRPGITNEICMQPRDAVGRLSLNSLDTHSGKITAEDAFIQYDVGVAHELLHSVGVDHHGDGDTQSEWFTLIVPGDPRNTTGQPLLQVKGQNVQVLPEQGNGDLASAYWARLRAALAQCQAFLANLTVQRDFPLVISVCQNSIQHFFDPSPIYDIYRSLRLYIGNPHAEHSGDDRCVMRYFFADVYPSLAPLVGTPLYYVVTPGTEPVGAMLCNSPTGNRGGVNDPNRNLPTGHPQPRYFDASRGDCQHQVCVNDKNPPASN
jgi:hypothetical protein